MHNLINLPYIQTDNFFVEKQGAMIQLQFCYVFRTVVDFCNLLKVLVLYVPSIAGYDDSLSKYRRRVHQSDQVIVCFGGAVEAPIL